MSHVPVPSQNCDHGFVVVFIVPLNVQFYKIQVRAVLFTHTRFFILGDFSQGKVLHHPRLRPCLDL